MRILLALCTLVLASFVYSQSELTIAEPCVEETCTLPNCRCSSTNIPGGLAPRDTPQFVTLTFDSAVNVNNMVSYRSFLYERKNKNNCPAGATFFVSHEYNDYTLVNELYNRGYEIALNSISRRSDQEYWREATYEILMREIGDQVEQMSHFAGIPRDSIKGVQSPLIQIAGNATYQMMVSAGLKYDLSWPTMQFTNPGLWPYTLNYASTQDCFIPPCPTASIPGPWVIPMITWSDLEGVPCTIVDACYYKPEPEDEQGWFNLIMTNFERHYLGNRAPFGFYTSEWYITTNPGLHRAFIRFLNMLNNLNDVFMVNANEVVEWVQNPIPINEYLRKDCKTVAPAQCRPAFCNSIPAEHEEKTYYMSICNRCPRVYPWVNNHLGN